ncbi:hypothetical protein HK101_011931 [Irineochytrium annulatum]|nr:hypothetical protein HK101_011931 [Irineochytrium annulatum]
MSAGSEPVFTPECVWAQRTDELYVTINVSDVENPEISLTAESLTFSGLSHGKRYKVELSFYKEVDAEASKQLITARNLTFVIAKKEQGEEYWPRLLKQAGKNNFLKTDFSKWKDEDEEEEAPPGMDMSQFDAMNGGMGGGMGGMGGMGNMMNMMGGMGGMGGMGMGGGGMPDFGAMGQDMDFSKFNAEGGISSNKKSRGGGRRGGAAVGGGAGATNGGGGGGGGGALRNRRRGGGGAVDRGRAAAPYAAPSNQIMITGLAPVVSQADLLELFTTIGKVKTCQLNFDASGRSLGTGTVIFRNKDDIPKAIQEYNNRELDGHVMKLAVAVSAAAIPHLAQPAATAPAGRPKTANGSTNAPARGGGRGGRRRKGGRSGEPKKPLTEEQLASELDNYMKAFQKMSNNDFSEVVDMQDHPEDTDIVVREAVVADDDAPGNFSWNPVDWYNDIKREFDDFSWTMDEKKRVLLRAVLGEGLVTFLFLFIVEATGVNNGRQENPENLVLGAISTAFCSVALIYSFADVSGAHFNPAVTWATIVAGKTSIKKGLLYIGVQLIASIFATLYLMACFPRPMEGSFKDIPSSVVVEVHETAHLANAFFMELSLTFILVYVIFATAFDTVDTTNSVKIDGEGKADKNAGKHLTIYTTSGNTKAGFAPLAIGFTLGFLCFIGGTVSGGAFNPARVFGPSILTGNWNNHWIYW